MFPDRLPHDSLGCRFGKWVPRVCRRLDEQDTFWRSRLGLENGFVLLDLDSLLGSKVIDVESLVK